MRARKRPTSTDRHRGAYTCEQTVEERIEGVLRRKRSLFQDIVDELTLELEDVLASAELFSLFDPTPTTGRM